MLINLPKPRTAPPPPPARPPREQLEPVALELIRRCGADILAYARRYAQTREDAEDAYQRGLEVLLTKAPSVHDDDLLPWLKTVVKHEAFTLRRQRERAGQPVPPDKLTARTDTTTAPHDHLEQLQRLQHGAEALARLKPAEHQCILLRAEGHSYKEIQAITGFSYTKVNRCLTEGRRSFLQRVGRIESGAECERLAPLLSALADGEASAADIAVLRPHLRSCLSCRAALRDAREVPARVAALAPLGLLAGAAHVGAPDAGGAVSALRSLGGWVQDRVTMLVLRGQEALEAATSHKLAAAASAAALGGGIATVEVSGSHPDHRSSGVPHALVARAPAATPVWRPAALVRAVPTKPATASRASAPGQRQSHPFAQRRSHRAAQRRATVTARQAQAEPPVAPIGPAATAPARAPAAPAQSRTPRDHPQTGEFGP